MNLTCVSSFALPQVVWDNVRILKNSGETVSVDGTHLGVRTDDVNNLNCVLYSDIQ